MRLSRGFWQTYKEVPADAEIPSHRLMIRAGLIHKSGAGLYNYLPMGYRVIRKIEQIVREEMDRADAHELLMTVVTPGELWRESGRWETMGGEMLKFKDKAERDLCISPTNEEAVADIFRKTVRSYKELPLTLYQINTKFRDEIRPRFGLMRGREFTMKDAYSFHMDKASLDEVYGELYKAYERIFERLGLNFSVVEADAGAMGDSDSQTHEFQVLAETGEDELVYCENTGYAANREKAVTFRSDIVGSEVNGELEEVHTPEMQTIEDVCRFLKCPASASLKSLIYKSIWGEKEEFHLVLLIGDDQLNELKLKNYLACDHLLPASDNEISQLGLEKGFIGPARLKVDINILFDKNIDPAKAYIVGANKKDKHIRNFSPVRDLDGLVQADLRLARPEDLGPDRKSFVAIKRGIEVGHIFQLGDKYTKALDVKILDQNGKSKAPLMGCYGIGITRLSAAAIEQNHDEKGVAWPLAIAPYHIHLIHIGKSQENRSRVEKIYETLLDEGHEVVFDDRNAGAGFKFKDAELLGLPLQVVLGDRDFDKDQMLEIRVRKSGEVYKVPAEELVEKVKETLDGLR